MHNEPFKFKFNNPVIRDDWVPTYVRTLQGFHRETGIWISLMTGVEDETDCLRKLWAQEQPDISKAFIRMADFSAFRFENMTSFTFAR